MGFRFNKSRQINVFDQDKLDRIKSNKIDDKFIPRVSVEKRRPKLSIKDRTFLQSIGLRLRI